ncbi:MAG: oligosaccharide flippase family protein [Clostridia bacterium]|nr:oligosaccharide flippase family protein [Clostridia bacterium]
MNNNIYRTTAQVTIFSIIEKSISFLYRIVLSRVIGAEGVGIYQIALSVFAVFLTAASSGVPVTVSRLITKQNAVGGGSRHAVVTAGIVSTLMFTVPACIIIFAGRNFFGFLFSDSRCLNVFLIILPGLILTSVYSVMRGTFWGNKDFLPYSLIELAEDAFMVVLGCILITGATDAADGASRAAIAVFVSYIFSFIVSLGWYFHKGGRLVNPKKQLKPLLASSLPITAMRTSTSLLNSLVAVLMPFLLVRICNMTNSDAVSLYGVAAGMSIPILFIPSSLIGSIAVVLAPELSENFYRNKTERLKDDVEKSLRAAVFIAFLLIPLLFSLGVTMGNVLFSDSLSGEIVKNCCIILLPMCISMITNTILNSMNREKQTLIYYFAGAAAMIACIAAFTSFAGIYSYVTGLGASFVVTAALNLRLLKKLCRGVKIFNFILKGIAVCAACCAFGWLFVSLIQKFLPQIAVLAVGGVAVAAFTLAFMYIAKMYTLEPLKGILNKRKGRKGKSAL